MELAEDTHGDLPITAKYLLGDGLPRLSTYVRWKAFQLLGRPGSKPKVLT